MVEKSELVSRIKALKEERQAVILAHYYTRPEIQELADYIGDSLALAQIAARLKEPVIVLCGVNFMADTAKILCPDKTVLLPDTEAGCSLADSCPADEFKRFVEAHPDHMVISYVNTSAEVKALSDLLVTSGNARKIVDSLPKDQKIIFGPDRNLGNYINGVTGREMLLWDGACHVHEQFSAEKLVELKREHPKARVLAHPECKKPLLMLADTVGSTAALLKAATEAPAGSEFIVVTESGILHEMRRLCPDKTFIPAPPTDSTCACNDCAFMKLNTLEKLAACLENMAPEITVDPAIAERARKPIERMLALS
ncbi:MAG: quinolinate synthase NadA [Bacteroides sp.]|nr:quinolinate synthase NadA [Bacteroides sp.]MBD5415264.1 quinolinate synthase NadA [Bacteroides sp.]MBD5425386.1 quinolinate synthase NadA [Bacteroides sp.]